MQKIQSSTRTRRIKRFVAIVGAIVGLFSLVLSMGVFAYVRAVAAESAKAPVTVPGQSPKPVSDAGEQPAETNGGFMANILLPPEKTNFLIVGLDEGESLTDAILVGSFDRETQRITVISVPRDTRITLSKEDIKALNDIGRYPPSHGVMKINAIHAYAGKEHGMEYLKKHLEELLEIEINYYAKVDLRAFRSIVTTVGGVWMDIPAGGLYYSDPEQDLTIKVPGGRQLLDGEMAEGVVRFRDSYRQGDLKRIEVQQEFMKQFFSQVISKDTIMKNAGGFLATVINYVRTDFGVQDIPLYLRYVTSLSAENIEFITLPGESDYQGEASYFFCDAEKTAELAQEVFHSKTAVKSAITGLRIQLLNGADAPELTEIIRERLEDAGAEVVEAGEYTGSLRTYTRVLSREQGIADGFKPYFRNIAEELDAVAISNRFDAVVIIGTGEVEE